MSQYLVDERIAELEHDSSDAIPAIVELGKDPGHCSACELAHHRYVKNAPPENEWTEGSNMILKILDGDPREST